MHPATILIPTAGLLIGPRLWTIHVLKQHHQTDEELPGTAAELAREWLDNNQLKAVQVEITDIGDHYDPQSRAIRLSRDKFDRKTLTAVTTAAHEVSHALQHASGYQPFVWRMRLGKLALTVGEIGIVMLIAIPAAAIISRQRIPPFLMGTTVTTMLAAGLAAQLVALPTELDASFRRALPMLSDGYIEGDQIRSARSILMASSLTYVAASLLSLLHIWPWLGRMTVLRPSLQAPGLAIADNQRRIDLPAKQTPTVKSEAPCRKRVRSRSAKNTEIIVRKYGKPLIRGWMKFSRHLAKP